MSSMPLYQIAADLNAITDALIENGGTLTPEMEADLAFLGDAFDQKVQRCALVIRNLEGLAGAAELEARRLQNLATVRLNAAKALKSYVKREMEGAEIDQVKGPLAVVRVQRNSRPAIAWPATSGDIPVAFTRVTVVLDGDKAYAHYKEHGTMPDGFEVTHSTHLRIS